MKTFFGYFQFNFQKTSNLLGNNFQLAPRPERLDLFEPIRNDLLSRLNAMARKKRRNEQVRADSEGPDEPQEPPVVPPSPEPPIVIHSPAHVLVPDVDMGYFFC